MYQCHQILKLSNKDMQQKESKSGRDCNDRRAEVGVGVLGRGQWASLHQLGGLGELSSSLGTGHSSGVNWIFVQFLACKLPLVAMFSLYSNWFYVTMPSHTLCTDIIYDTHFNQRNCSMPEYRLSDRQRRDCREWLGDIFWFIWDTACATVPDKWQRHNHNHSQLFLKLQRQN